MQRLQLQREQLGRTGGCQVEHQIELMPAERVSLRGSLDLHESAAIVHDDIHVRLSLRVLGVVEIEHGCAPHDADGDSRYLAVDRARRDHPALQKLLACVNQRHVCAGNRRGASSTVGLQNIAIDRHGSLAERFEIEDRSQ